MTDILSRFAGEHPEDAFWRSVLEALSPVETRLSGVIKTAIKRARKSADYETIAGYIEVGDYDRAVSLVLGKDAGDTSAFIALRTSMDQAAVKYMQDLASKKIKGIQVPHLIVELDVLNEATLEAIRTQTMDAVTNISNATRAGLRKTLEIGMVNGDPPREIASNMVDSLGLTERDAVAVNNYRAELERGSRAALQRELRNRKFDQAVMRGDLEDDRIKRMVQDYTERLIRSRADSIARTESARAFTIGQQQLWEEAARSHGVEKEHLKRFWIIAPGERTCEWCRYTAKINALGVGMHEPFVTPDGLLLLPPGHPRCRCTIIVKVDVESAVRTLVTSNRGF